MQGWAGHMASLGPPLVPCCNAVMPDMAHERRWLQPLLQRLARDTQIFGPGRDPNHVLLNAYKPGQGIMPHQDGPLYHPGVCILSLGSPTVMHFTRKSSSGGNTQSFSPGL